MKHLLLITLFATIPAFTRGAGPAFISPIPDQTIAEQSHSLPISFTVSSASATLQGSSSDEILIPSTNIVFAGKGTDRTVTVGAAPNRFGHATVTIKSGGSDGSAITSFLVTVNASVHIARTNGQAFLSWSATNAIPQQASGPNGPWFDTTLSSPYRPSGSQPQFFRLRAE